MAPSDQLVAGSNALVDAAFITGDYGTAEKILDDALQEATRTGDDAARATAICRLGMVMHYQALQDGVTDDATAGEEAIFRDALEIARAANDSDAMTEALFGLGIVNQVLRRDWDAAMPYFREALELVEDGGGDLMAQAEVHRHMGFHYLVEGSQPAKAVEHLQTSLDLREQFGDRRRLATANLALGQAKIAAGEVADGLRLLREATRLARAEGFKQFWIDLCDDAVREAESTVEP